MRASLYGRGVTAVADVHDDGSVTLAMLDDNDQTICLGQWQAPEPAMEREQETSWQPRRRASA